MHKFHDKTICQVANDLSLCLIFFIKMPYNVALAFFDKVIQNYFFLLEEEFEKKLSVAIRLEYQNLERSYCFSSLKRL